MRSGRACGVSCSLSAASTASAALNGEPMVVSAWDSWRSFSPAMISAARGSSAAAVVLPPSMMF